jgi:hypothetical protein
VPVFFIIGIPVAILFVGLAFFKPYGQSLPSFIVFGALYYFRPKVYIWKRAPQAFSNAPQKIQTTAVAAPDKHMSAQSLTDLAELLDSEGSHSNAELEKMLKHVSAKK